MKRWLGWTLFLGLGGALATGCVSRQTEDAQQVGRPYTPEQQKYKAPTASESQSGLEAGQGGSGNAGRKSEGAGPYQPSQPQPIPRERRPAPLGVGAGPDNARKLAMEQLKH
jgi:hypothetical protein